MCDDGFDCSTGKNIQRNYTVCPLGNKCKGGIDGGIEECDGPNEYQNLLGQEECFSCPEGFLCTATVTPEPCKMGYYCFSGSELECSAGTYRDKTHGSRDSCFDCEPGYACPESGDKGLFPSVECEAGHFCIQGATSNVPEENSQYANVCPAGHYCPNSGDSTPNRFIFFTI